MRQLYLELLRTDPRRTISPLDLDISRSCEQFMKNEPTLKPLKGSVGKKACFLIFEYFSKKKCFCSGASSLLIFYCFLMKGAFYGMKAVLSYHHALKRTRNSLAKQDLLLMIPLIETNHITMNR